ncbi:hypothetical protein JCM11641_001566 [Rhodosporidiobolus odoratus]
MASAHPPSAGGGLKLKLKVGGAPAIAAASAAQPPTAIAPQALYTNPPPAPAPVPLFGGESTRYGGGNVAYGPAGDDEDEDDEDRVSASKYRKLKKKYFAAVESRDDASLALFRAQKLIHRLREDKSALLDRVVHLEVAAGLTSQDVSLSRDDTLRTERELAFPLLHPPPSPSTADRIPKTPATVAPLSRAFLPRQRSQHLRTAIAAQKLRDARDAQLAARGLPKPSFPAVAVLGLEGSNIAGNVERALAGEALQPVAEAPARGSKRRRESSMSVPRGKGRAASASAPVASAPPPPANNLPNPFAAIGASIPVGAAMSRNNADVLASVSVPPSISPASLAVTHEIAPVAYEDDVAMDEPLSDDNDPLQEDEDYKPLPKRGGRKSGVESGVMKPKKVRAHGVTSGTHAVPPIIRNPDGTPRLPVHAGILQVRSLGTVDLRSNFSTERYIFPVGYEANRRYASMVDPYESADYVCRVIDGGNNAPRFELHPSDQPGVVITTGTPTGCWSAVVKASNKIRNKQHSGSISGPDYFGFSHNTVKALIQELPGASQVPGYIWQTFVEDPNAGLTVPKKFRRSTTGLGDMEASPAPESIEVSGGDGGYNGDYAVNGEYGSPMPGEYGQAEGSPDQYADDLSSLHQLLAAANPDLAGVGVDPYAIPPAAQGVDPFLAVAAAANAVTPAIDPYAIPPTSQPMIDPAFGDYGQGTNAFAYSMPGAGEDYPTNAGAQ